GPFALTDALVAVGGLFQEVHRGDDRRARAPRIVDFFATAREVEAGERGSVAVAALAHQRVAESREEGARSAVVAAALARDGRPSHLPGALVDVGGAQVVLAAVAALARPGLEGARLIDGGDLFEQ